jgi:hypothetical protein
MHLLTTCTPPFNDSWPTNQPPHPRPLVLHFLEPSFQRTSQSANEHESVHALAQRACEAQQRFTGDQSDMAAGEPAGEDNPGSPGGRSGARPRELRKPFGRPGPAEPQVKNSGFRGPDHTASRPLLCWDEAKRRGLRWRATETTRSPWSHEGGRFEHG